MPKTIRLAEGAVKPLFCEKTSQSKENLPQDNVPQQTAQPRGQTKDLGDYVALGGTAREQGTRELPGPNLGEVGFEIMRKQFMHVQGQWERKAEENKPLSSSQCNCSAIFVLVTLITTMVFTNREKIY